MLKIETSATSQMSSFETRNPMRKTVFMHTKKKVNVTFAASLFSSFFLSRLLFFYILFYPSAQKSVRLSEINSE